MLCSLVVDEQVGGNVSSCLERRHAQISGLSIHAGLNGQKGELCGYVEVEDRWKVWLQDGGGKRLRPENLEICSSDCKSKVGCGEFALGGHDGGADFVVKVGDRVCIHSSLTHVSLNGSEGEVIHFNGAERRWKVRLDTGQAKMVRTDHLQVISSGVEPTLEEKDPQAQPAASSAFVYGDRVKVRSVLPGSSQAECCEGQIVSYDFDENRWRVWMHDGSGRLFKTESVLLLEHSQRNTLKLSFDAGTNVKIVGLRARADLNGQQAEVIGIAEQDRVRVRLFSNGTQLCLRRASLQAVEVERGSMSCGVGQLNVEVQTVKQSEQMANQRCSEVM